LFQEEILSKSQELSNEEEGIFSENKAQEARGLRAISPKIPSSSLQISSLHQKSPTSCRNLLILLHNFIAVFAAILSASHKRGGVKTRPHYDMDPAGFGRGMTRRRQSKVSFYAREQTRLNKFIKIAI
jgi:hypothetical protein